MNNGLIPSEKIKMDLTSWIHKHGGFPVNEEAEKAMLGSVFWSYQALQKVCEEVSKEVFFTDRCRIVFEAIQFLYQNKKPVDAGTVTSEIINRGQLIAVGNMEFLDSIYGSVATGENVSFYIDSVLEKYTLRRMMEMSINIISNIGQEEASVREVVETAEKNILNISKSRKTSEFRTVQEVLDKAQNDLETLAKNKGKVTGLTTGLVDLDNLTNGFSPTQLIIVAARPAVGKTAFALNIACAAAKSTKKNIAVFSLEMPAEQLIMRMISSLGQVDHKKLQTGRLENEDWRRVNEAIIQLADTNILFHDAGGVTASEIKAKCRRLAMQGEGLGLVIIDYLQLIDSSSKYSGSRQQEVSEISRNLKTMALELEVPVIALSQLSRSVEKREDKKPVLSDLRESGSIEQDADIVAALHAPDVEVPIDDNLPVPIQLIILKHRNGPIATIDMLFKKKTSTFLSIKKDGDNNAK